jgi:hypothetical protein
MIRAAVRVFLGHRSLFSSFSYPDHFFVVPQDSSAWVRSRSIDVLAPADRR